MKKKTKKQNKNYMLTRKGDESTACKISPKRRRKSIVGSICDKLSFKYRLGLSLFLLLL